ncbi:MAG: hypothetical protein HY535_05990, partial [Chloroflexi bacterium]|nr:hypothetical protein [Chloroflexota bacterium]
YDKLGAEYQVSPRTIQRWVKGENAPRKPRQTPDDDWPESRQWPADWTIDGLADLKGFNRNAWEGNLGLIEVAQRQGTRYIPWFFRRLVETARRYQMDARNANPWFYAIAAAPVVADWLSEPSFAELGVLIEAKEPWKGKQERKAYLKQAQTLSRRVADGVSRALIVPPPSLDPQYPVTLLLRFLVNWQPAFDRPPLIVRLAQLQIGQLFLLLLRNPKPTYGGTP